MKNKCQNQQDLPGQITRKQRHLDNLINILKEADKRNVKLIKKLNLSICIHHKELTRIKKDLEAFNKTSDKITVSERLGMFFKVAKGLKPNLSKEIDKLLEKE